MSTATATATAPNLLAMSKDQLDALFSTGAASPLPNGEGAGQAIIAEGTAFTPVVAGLINAFVWKGKVFDAAKGTLENKILPIGWDAVSAKVYPTPSIFDQKPCIVLDYTHSDVVLAKPIRDEIRLIAPGLYLGRVYWDGKFIFHFSLQF